MFATMQILHFVVNFEFAEDFLAEIALDVSAIRRSIVRVTTQKYSKNQTTWYVLKASALTLDGGLLQLTLREDKREAANHRQKDLKDELIALGCDVRGGAISAGE